MFASQQNHCSSEMSNNKKQRLKSGVKSASSKMAADLLSRNSLITFDSLSHLQPSVEENEDSVAFHKLNKRDSLTREKALRELLERTVQDREVTVLSAFQQLTSHFERLIFDCCPVVRSLTVRLLAKQLSILKKKAEKSFVQVLPWVFFATCDPYPQCSTEATSLLSSNFTLEKIELALNAVTPSILSTIRDIIITESSDILLPSRLLHNEQEDSKEERKKRISEQSLMLLTRLIRRKDSEEAKAILIERLAKEKGSTAHLSRGLLEAVVSCPTVSDLVRQTNLFLSLLSSLSSPSTDSFLLNSLIDLMLLLLSDQSFDLTNDERSKLAPATVALIKRCSTGDWNVVWKHMLPLFSTVISRCDPSKATQFICDSLRAFQSVTPSTQSASASMECMKFVMAKRQEDEKERNTILQTVEGMSEWSSACEAVVDLILWMEARESEKDLLRELLMRLVHKMPSSTETAKVVTRVLSTHRDGFSFLWSILSSLNHPLPLHLLQSAPDELLVSLDSCLDVMSEIERESDPSLSSLYSRLFSLLPPSSLPSTSMLSKSAFVSGVIDSISDTRLSPFISCLSTEVKRDTFKYLASTNNATSAIRFVQAKGFTDCSLEEELCSLDASPLQFLAPLCKTLLIQGPCAVKIGEKVLREMLREQSKDTDISVSASFVIRQLSPSTVIRIFMDTVSSLPLPVSPSRLSPLSSLFFSISQEGLTLFDSSHFFSFVDSLLVSLSPYLSEECQLFSSWFSDLSSSSPCTSSSQHISSFSQLIDNTFRIVAFLHSVYVNRPEDVPCGAVLLSLFVLANVVDLSRRSWKKLKRRVEGEKRLMEQVKDLYETSEGLCLPLIPRLLSSSSLPALPLLLSSLQPLSPSIPSGSISVPFPNPFSPLPSQEDTVHIESCRRLFYRRSSLQVLLDIRRMDESCSLFTLSSSDAHLTLSLCALSATIRILQDDGELSNDNMDWIECGLVTALNSCDQDEVKGEEGKWREYRRRLLAMQSIACANEIEKRKKRLNNEEWDDFFLPSITCLALKMYAESWREKDSTLTRLLCLFLTSLHTVEWREEWGEGWDSRSIRYHTILDQSGCPVSLQSIILRAMEDLEESDDWSVERITASVSVLAGCCKSLLSWSTDESDSVVLFLPAFLKQLSLQDGWGSAAVLRGAVHLVEGDIEGGGLGVEEARDEIAHTISPLMTTPLSFIVAKAEAMNLCWKSTTYTVEEDDWSEEEWFEFWLASLLRSSFSSFPNTVRMWYSSLPKNATSLVFKFISSSVSPILIDEQLRCVLSADLAEKYKNDQATLNIKRHANELSVEYGVEDTKMTLLLTLPVGWPLLSAVSTVEGSIVGVDDGRKWLLQLNSHLHRNASIERALSVWLRSAGKKVEGTEACTICMMLVAPQTKQLPKARCRTCKNKFHSSCLYKWFDSSNQSSCPLCRTDFTAPP